MSTDARNPFSLLKLAVNGRKLNFKFFEDTTQAAKVHLLNRVNRNYGGVHDGCVTLRNLFPYKIVKIGKKL